MVISGGEGHAVVHHHHALGVAVRLGMHEVRAREFEQVHAVQEACAQPDAVAVQEPRPEEVVAGWSGTRAARVFCRSRRPWSERTDRRRWSCRAPGQRTGPPRQPTSRYQSNRTAPCRAVKAVVGQPARLEIHGHGSGATRAGAGPCPQSLAKSGLCKPPRRWRRANGPGG